MEELVGLEFNGPVNTIKVDVELVRLPDHTFLGKLCPQSGQPVHVHILSPETDNCPS